jgi:hypothetical protein
MDSEAATQIAELLERQHGLIARFQAREAGLSDTELARLLRRREWHRRLPGVYSDHNGPLTWTQRAWAAVLSTWPAALAGSSALRAFEGPGRRDNDDEAAIHVVVARDRRLPMRSGVVIHRSAHLDERVQWNLSPPRTRYHETVLDLAAGAKDDLAAVAVLADACGSRRTTAQRLLDTLDRRDRIPRREWLEAVLGDVASGACSVLERGYLELVERAHGLPVGVRQVPRLSSEGQTWQDVLYDELGVAVELDGRAFHSSATARDRDLERDLDNAVEQQRTTIRLGYGQVFGRPCRTAGRLAKLFNRRGWPGEPSRCALCGAEHEAA